MNKPSLELQPGDRAFSRDATQGFTMPARLYHDPEIFQAERQAIFFRSWIYIGHVSQVAEAGQYIQARIHDQNVFVIRDRAGALNGFFNVCMHRGHELLDGTGKTNLIRCPYHAWAYDLDGTLKAARNSENVEGFDRCAFSLRPVRVEVFCGLVMVNLDPDAVPFKEQTGDLEAEIRHYVPSVDRLAFAQRDTYDVAANWKVLIDNFLECYHCHCAHKDFVDLVDMDSYRTVVHGIYSSQLAEAPRTTKANAYEFVPGEVDFGYAGWFVWPNISIWAYPGEPNLSVLQMNPGNGPENCIEYQDWFVPDGKPTKQLADAMAYQKDVLQPEDIGLCESVQRGLHSLAYNQGRFIVDRGRTELSEHAVHHFQSMVVEALGMEMT